MISTPIDRRTLLRFASLALVPAATSCAGLIPGTGAPPQLYVLMRKTTFPADLPQVSRQLLVDTPIAPAEIDTARVALTRSPTTIDYFANAAWSDRAPAMVQSLLIESFEQTGKIPSLARDSAVLRADYILMPELRRFEARYQNGEAPPTVLVRLLVRLIKMPERSIIGEDIAEAQETAALNNMDSIVEAYNEALGSVMKRLVTWTLRTMAQDIGPR
ncbi:MAG TPA: ABC-type transport auxiliary lipoprotein family protein [Stellaceae bacterium]|jgi:cholesterol transport system auxiliary component|nr:ABC-type transport auxiliary lipoprotein family protein [Stellaceae bacterium]